MKLYYSPGACSLAAHVALEEANADFEPVCTAIAKQQHRTPEFLARNPQGRVPVLEVGGQVLTELGAILLYINERYPRAGLMPQGIFAYGQAVSLMNFLASNLHIAFASIWRPERFVADPALHAELKTQGERQVLEHLQTVESRLPATGWLSGEAFTVADMNLLPFYRWGWRIGLDMAQFPRYTRLVGAASQRAAVQCVLKREGLASLLAPAATQASSQLQSVA